MKINWIGELKEEKLSVFLGKTKSFHLNKSKEEFKR